MPAAAWVTVLVTFAAAVVVPGPDTFLVLKLGMRNRRAALWGAVGIMTGNAVWTTASVAGLAALVVALPGLLPILQLIGAAVLGWMGVQGGGSAIRALRERRDRAVVRDSAGADRPQTADISTRVPVRRPMWQGFVTNMSNPKALLFFTALFSQVLPAEATLFDRVMVVVALSVVGLAWFVSFALLTSSRTFQRWFGRATPVIDLIASFVFLLVAAFVIVELGVTVLSGP